MNKIKKIEKLLSILKDNKLLVKEHWNINNMELYDLMIFRLTNLKNKLIEEQQNKKK